MLQRVLVGLDGSTLAEAVLPYVQALLCGRNTATEVTFLNVLHLPADVQAHVAESPELQAAVRQAAARAYAYLQRQGQPFHEQGTKVYEAVAIGDTPAEIVACAEQQQVDLIALATHGQFGLGRSLSGSVAETVLLTSEKPLLVIRPTAASMAAPSQVTQVIVPLDGSHRAEEALAYGGAIAAHLDVPLVLLRVVERPHLAYEDKEMPAALSAALFDGLMAGLQQAAAVYLADVASRLAGVVPKVQTVTTTGWPVNEIAQFAEHSPGSLIVLTTQGKREQLPQQLGSTARRVVQTTSAPTLIVRPAGAAEITA